MLGATLTSAGSGSRYAVERMLGGGGMGSVYAATQEHSGRRVALKVMPPTLGSQREFVKRFAREASAVRAIHSPHVAAILDAGTDAATGTHFIAMELLDGEDLAHLVARLGPLSPRLVAKLAVHACLGLEAAHRAQVVHRDIKPANLFLARGDEGKRLLKIVDFGLAKLKMDEAASEESALATQSGMLLGTPRYLSPEQARADKSIDHRTDLWALGVVMFHLLSGTTPSRGVEGIAGILVNICTTPAPLVTERARWVPPELAAIVAGLLEIDRDRRFPSAEAPRAALEAWLQGDASIDEAMVLGWEAASAKGLDAPGAIERPAAGRAAPRVTALGTLEMSLKPVPAPAPEANAGNDPPAISGISLGAVSVNVADQAPDPTSDLSSPATIPLRRPDAAAPASPGIEAPQALVSASGPATAAPRGGRRLEMAGLGLAAASALVAIGLASRHESTEPPQATSSSAAARAVVAPNGSGSGHTNAGETTGTPREPPTVPTDDVVLYAPSDLAVAADGSLFVAARGTHRVRVVRKGRLETYAGTGEQGFRNGPVDQATFRHPTAVALASDGSVVLTDTGNHCLREIRDGVVRTLAGSGRDGSSDGRAEDASFQAPDGLAFASDGTLYISDSEGHSIRTLKDGVVSTLAGGPLGFADGDVRAARFQSPGSMAFGPKGELYVLDAGAGGINRIRVIQDGKVATLVTYTAREPEGTTDATRGAHANRNGLACGPDGRVVVTNGADARIFVVDDGKLAPFAGSGTRGLTNEHVTTARFAMPVELAFAPDGALYVVDPGASAIRVVREHMVETVVAGRAGGYADGPKERAEFSQPWSVRVRRDGSVVVADRGNERVRAIAGASVTTLAGTGERGFFDGNAENARFSGPFDVSEGSEGELYIADASNHRIRVLRDGVVSTFAGTGLAGLNDGPVAAASFHRPEGVATDPSGAVYVAEAGSHRIRVIRGGRVSVLAGTGQPGYVNGDALKEAQFAHPGAIEVDAAGVAYVADAGNHVIRAIDRGRVRTLAGTGEPGFEDGSVEKARFDSPVGIALGPDGVIYVADAGNHRIRVIDRGVVRTVAGTGTPGLRNGPALESWLARPSGVAVAPNGDVWISDTANHAIRILRGGMLEFAASH